MKSPDSNDPVLAPHAPLTEFYQQPENRATYVNRLFDNSAQYYDWISSVLSFGMDKLYRRMALQKAGLQAGMRVLDVATGTGLVAEAALRIGIRPADLIGLDPSRGMLLENQKGHNIPLVQSIGERLPFADRTFDFVVMGYALRHVESLHALFTEFRRVLKPGGRALILEISRPDSQIGFKMLRFYMQKFVPWLARRHTSNPDLATLMEYYWATIAECVPPQSIVEALQASGLTNVQRKTYGPILNDYVGNN